MWAELAALEKDPMALEDAVAYAIHSHPTKRRLWETNEDEETVNIKAPSAARSGKISPRKTKVKSVQK